jgi:hypothetical protein
VNTINRSVPNENIKILVFNDMLFFIVICWIYQLYRQICRNTRKMAAGSSMLQPGGDLSFYTGFL